MWYVLEDHYISNSSDFFILLKHECPVAIQAFVLQMRALFFTVN